MTGKEFETMFTELLSNQGFWVLNIPKNESGAQPFDIIALRTEGLNTTIYAFDCKVCSKNRFPLNRVEDNQWLALEDFRRKVGLRVKSGIVCYHNRNIYRIDFDKLERARYEGRASVGFQLDDDSANKYNVKGGNYGILWYVHDEIKQLVKGVYDF